METISECHDLEVEKATCPQPREPEGKKAVKSMRMVRAGGRVSSSPNAVEVFFQSLLSRSEGGGER